MDPVIADARRALAARFGLVPRDGLRDSALLARALPLEARTSRIPCCFEFGCFTLIAARTRVPALEAAFVNYYVGVGDAPRDMERHVDCDWRGEPVPLSCVIQGAYPDPTPRHESGGDPEAVLGTLDVQRAADARVNEVSLRAGDCLVLARALHKPHPVPDGARRLVFVLFFSALHVVGGGGVE